MSDTDMERLDRVLVNRTTMVVKIGNKEMRDSSRLQRKGRQTGVGSQTK